MTSRNASFHETGLTGALLAPLKWGCLTFLAAAGLLATAWMIDCFFVFHVWPEKMARLELTLQDDLAHVARIGGEAGLKAATKVANLFYEAVFGFTGIHDMGLRFAQGRALSIPDTIARDAYTEYYAAIQVAMVSTQLFGVRLVALAMGLPLLVLCYVVAFADGLTQRSIRKASGGRESAGLYHRAKYLQLVAIAMLLAGVLLTPASIDPRWFWIATALAVAVLARVQWTYCKKYL